MLKYQKYSINNPFTKIRTENEKTQKRSQTARINVDEIMNLINDKLSTGFHGVEHLFRSIDNSKDGRLSKEAFKWVLNQLCGYISSEAWQKICYRFNLNNKDSISFDEFISYFLDNQKVQKEIITASKSSANKRSLQYICFNSANPLAHSTANDSIQPSKLSANYCLALLRAKFSQSDFDPSQYLPHECLNNTKLVMPHHLEHLLREWNLDLSDSEFEKLWHRFDLNNSGGVKCQVFLRLLNYKPYELDTLSHNLDLIRTRTSISFGARPKQQQRFFSRQKSWIGVDVDDSGGVRTSEANEREETTPRTRKQTTKGTNRSSLSAESRVKSMVRMLKNASKFGPGYDLVAFLNNKLNEGLMLMRTAFEYVDQEGFGYLLSDEFRSVLEEFNIRIPDTRTYHSLLKKYCLLKRNQLVDYLKFLRAFQDKRKLNKAERLDASNTSSRSLIETEKFILEFFHGNFDSIFDYFNDSIGDGQNECSVAQFKRLIEQKFSISIDNQQMKSLIEFVTNNRKTEEVNDETRIKWIDVLGKFSSLDPWKIFNESRKSHKTSQDVKEQSNKNDENVENARKVEIEFKESEELVSSDEEDELKKACQDDGENKEDEQDFAIKRYFQSIPSVKQSAQLRNTLRKELKKIKRLERKIEKVFRSQFHHVNKLYSIIDTGHTEKIDKEKFRLLLDKCDVSLSQADLDLLWKDFEDEVILFSNLVRRFFKPDEFDRLREVHFKKKIEETIKSDLENSRKGAMRSSINRLSRSLSLDVIRRPTPRPKMSPNLIEKLKNFMLLNANDLKLEFEKADQHFDAYISKTQAMEIFKKFDLMLSKEDFEALLNEFDLNETDFDYVKFFNHFKKSSSGHNQQQTLNPILKQMIMKLRETATAISSLSAAVAATAATTVSHNQQSLIPQRSDLTNLRNAFKKLDSCKRGYLEQAEFRSFLNSMRIEATSNDMYAISAEFDPDLKGVFCYEMFLKTLINSIISK